MENLETAENIISSKQEVGKTNLSRRKAGETALKLGAVLTSMAAMGTGFKEARAKSPDTEFDIRKRGIERNKDLVVVETKNAEVTILLDNDLDTRLNAEVVNLVKPHILLNESGAPASDILSAQEWALLQFEGGNPGLEERRPLFDEETLKAMAAHDTQLVFTCDGIPEKAFWSSFINQLAFPAASLLYQAGRVAYDVSDKGIGMKTFEAFIGRGQNWTRLMGNLISAWGITAGSPLAIDMIRSGITNEDANKILRSTEGMLTNLHPENTIYFFRNLIMTSRINALASSGLRDKFGLKENEKMKIMLRVGENHEGLKEMLDWSPDLINKLIASYPKEFLRKVMDLNGGEDLFVTIGVTSVKDNLVPPGRIKSALKDVKLKEQIDRAL